MKSIAPKPATLVVLLTHAIAVGQEPAITQALTVEQDQTIDALVEEILSTAGARTGFCVVPCCNSTRLVSALVRQSNSFVHVLESDEAGLDRVRRAIESTGTYGRRASAELGRLSRLPYPDYCANLIVCDFPELPRERAFWTELIRVLRPGGLAYVGQSAQTAATSRPISAETLRAKLKVVGVSDFEIVETHGLWARIRCTRPAGMGQWSHGRWGTPGNNPCVDDSLVKAPFHTSWIAKPNSFTKFGLPLAAEGRVLLRHGGITYEGRYKPSQQPDLIEAFDAYNGTLLWRRRLEEPQGDGFVAMGDRVFAAGRTTLVGLDARDGSVAWRLQARDVAAGMNSWGPYRAADGLLVAAVYDAPPGKRVSTRPTTLAGLSPADGSIAWKLPVDDGVDSFALGQGKCFYSSQGALVSIQIADSREVWCRPMAGSGIVRYHRGMVYTDSASFKAADGTPGRRGGFRGVMVGDRLYAGGLKGVSVADLVTGETVPSFPVPRDPYCPKTGIPDGCSFMYGRCILPTASTNCYFFSYGGTVIGDLLRNEVFPCESFRSNCRTGAIVANGLVYNSPSGCGCSFPVRGGVCLAPVDESLYWCRAESGPPPQLEKGAAFAEEIAQAGTRDAWPCFRHDPARSGVTESPAPWPVSRRWLVAGDKVLIASASRLSALSRAGGAMLGHVELSTNGKPMLDGVIVAENSLFVATTDGEIVCFAAQ